MSKHNFQKQIEKLTTEIGSKPLDQSMEDWLNSEHGPQSSTFQALKQSCLKAIEEGWMCDREAGGIRYGRVLEPSQKSNNFSVDVVDMQDIVGPHHNHPQGEIDLVMPLQGNALFDDHAAGWVVYPPGSAHNPSVSGGRALVLYLLPQGSIEFTR